MATPSRSFRGAAPAAATLVLLAAGAALLASSRGPFSDTTGNSGNTFTAAACFLTSSTYDFTGITSPSSTHTAEDGEIDVSDAVIDAGTFGARRNTITGWANWGEATTGEYANMVGSDNLYYQGADPGLDDNAAMIFEFTVAEGPSCITQIDVNVEAAQGGAPGADDWFVYVWDYNTSSHLVGGSGNGTTDQVVSFSVTTNPGNHVQTSDGQLTVFVVNKNTDDWIRVDDITVTVSQAATAAVSGTLVPSGTEAEIVAGAETLVITLTDDTWDPTIGADNAKTTALINGIDSAQSEATGWDAVVKANMTFNDVTRTSDTVVTITLGVEATYDITADETITVTVPATALTGGVVITATPTFTIVATASGCPSTSTTYDFSGVSSPSSTHTAEDGEIDQSDTVITNGTFSARRNTIGGWLNWGEATTAEYSNLVGSDNLYYQGADPGFGDNAAMIFEFTVAEDPSCITQIDVNVEAAQGGAPGADLLFVYLWDYTTSSYLVGGSMNGTTDQVVSFSVTTNPANYVQTSDGQLTVFVVNEDTSDWIRVDDITVTVTQAPPAPTAALSGSLVPSGTEAEIVAGGETLVITLSNDTWDPTIGADNAKTTALINGIDSAQAEAAGWDAVVKANMTFNDVTRTSATVVTITLGVEATYNIRTAETITVTVPATAVASGGPITATPTFDIDGYHDSWTTGTTHTVSAGSNRLLLVAVYGEDSGAIASVATVTWGGQTLTEIGEATVGTGYSNLVWLGYLDETGIAAATGSTIVATWSGTTPNQSVLYAAVTLDNVDQVTPIGDSSTGTATNASTVQPLAALGAAIDDVAVYATVSGEQGETHTPPTGYFEGTEQDSGGTGQVAANAAKTITAAGTEQPTATWTNSNVRLGIVAAVVKPAP